jgi:hypothetical protein
LAATRAIATGRSKEATQVRRLLIGAGVAAALGLTAGGVLRPNLTLQGGSIEMEAIPQPQAVETAEAVSYSGPAPDYVLGSDWVPRNDAAIGRALAEAPKAASPSDQPPADSYERVEFDADAREPAASPSERGDILASSHAAEPPAPADEDSAPAPPGV